MTRRRLQSVALILLAVVMVHDCLAQQISIPRIDLMPNLPSPYFMRDWKQVARGYDSLVFDLNRTGTYLPLIWLNTSTVNYPSQISFGLNTVVGTTAPTSAEAINCLPAVIGATLAGVDQTAFAGRNWVLMCQEWFNKRPEQNVYKNHPVDDTGDDWWYETMPNVFFYQLNALYPGTGYFANQFTTVADRWLLAVKTMGGSSTPWHFPNMDHRGWYLQTMTPEDNGVHEPEAAGAIGWLLYQAWVSTKDVRYRIGAEWAMEFLSGLPTNPSYELQLSYGTYLAARMNAELGTTYDVSKMVNWCFDVGPLRSWGSMVGTWGGYDCDGLIGEVNGTNDYAFAMNTFEQIGALVPLVRYDCRFATTIGKWTLNAANASRLFYPNMLPALNQDSYAWARQYDPASVIAHEALRQFNGGTSPYGTGDAISGGWGATTLTLYGSSHVGILAGIIDTTNVPGILRLNLLKTDYYHAPAYPSYLFYNPYDSTRSVALDVGSGQHDLYDAVSHAFVQTGVSGTASLPIPAGSAMVVVSVPAAGSITYQLEKTLVNDTVLDYHSGHPVADYPPRIKALTPDSLIVLRGDTISVYCTGVDRDGDTLSYGWHLSGGTQVGSGASIRWIAPDTIGQDTITCVVDDGKGGFDTAFAVISVVAFLNQPPQILQMGATPRKVDLDSVSTIACSATDADGDTLTYFWSTSQGSISGSGPSVKWTAPPAPANATVHCTVSDGHGNAVSDSISLEVRDFSVTQHGQLILYLPCNGTSADASGYNHAVTNYGASLTTDHTGTPNSALAFNGTSNFLEVKNDSVLNCQQAISVCFWMYIGAFFTREQYPISHGNWTNRWKVSISNEHLRWTVKTAASVKDLDSDTRLSLNTWYHVTTVYNGSDFEVYLNGNLDAFSSLSGSIVTTTIDLTVGQDLPSDQQYNFRGSLDDIRVYNYGLSMSEIDTLAGITVGVHDRPQPTLPATLELSQNYPNPFNPSTAIRFGVPGRSFVTLKVFNILGQRVATLFEGPVEPGYHTVVWYARQAPSGVYYCRLAADGQSITGKLLLIR